MSGQRVSEVSWTATDPASGRRPPVETRSNRELLQERIDALRKRGSGYIEVARGERPYPVLAISLEATEAVVHLFSTQDRVSLLNGDGSRPSSTSNDFLVMDEPATFTGDFIVSIDRACEVLSDFLDGALVESLGHWTEL